MTAPTTMLSDDFWPLLAMFHGHRCPMSIMGARLGAAAAARLGRHGEKGDVSAVFFNRNCALDGIQLALGTTLGNRNIKVDPRELNFLEAENSDLGLTVKVVLTEEALALGRRYSELRRTEGAQGEREELLLKLQTLPEAEVVEVTVKGCCG